jgi:putative ABC transport system permease protein
MVLVFMQIGFRYALLDSNVSLIEKFDADLVLVSRKQSTLALRESFSRRRLYQAAGVRGVAAVRPLYVEYHLSELRGAGPREAERAARRPIRVVGIDLDAPALKIPEIGQASTARALLGPPGHALFDRRGRAVFGPLGPGMTELAGRKIRLVGGFDLGSDFGADSTLLVSAETFGDVLRRPGSLGSAFAEVEFGLVRLQGGADREAVRRAIQERLAAEGDVDVLTREGLKAREQKFWLENTPIGIVFGLMVCLGLGVGGVICYHVLSSDVADRLSEYATLKAMGYSNGYLNGVVMRQALLLAGTGFVPSLLVSWLLYRLFGWWTNLPLRLTWGRVGFVLAATAVLGVGSGLVALWKARRADPAEVLS